MVHPSVTAGRRLRVVAGGAEQSNRGGHPPAKPLRPGPTHGGAAAPSWYGVGGHRPPAGSNGAGSHRTTAGGRNGSSRSASSRGRRRRHSAGGAFAFTGRKRGCSGGGTRCAARRRSERATPWRRIHPTSGKE